MRSLQEIKDEYAREHGYVNWNSFFDEFKDSPATLVNTMDHVAVRHAIQAIEKCAESAEAGSGHEGTGAWVDTDSILNVKKLLR